MSSRKDPLEFVYDVLRLLLGEPKTRVPKLIIVSAIAMIASPWWHPAATSILVKYLEVDERFFEAFDTSFFWGGWLLFAFGVVLYIRATRESPKPGSGPRDEDIHSHDIHIFKESNRILSEEHLRAFLDRLQTDDSYTLSAIDRTGRFAHFFASTENGYINTSLSEPLSSLINAVNDLLLFLEVNSFVYPRNQLDGSNTRYCLHPSLNSDRDGSGATEEMAEYSRYRSELDLLATAVRSTYRHYRNAVKSTLAV